MSSLSLPLLLLTLGLMQSVAMAIVKDEELLQDDDINLVQDDSSNHRKSIVAPISDHTLSLLAPVYDPSWDATRFNLGFKSDVAQQSKTLSTSAADLAKTTQDLVGQVNDKFKAVADDKKKAKASSEAVDAETKQRMDEMEQVIKDTEKANKATRDAELLAAKLKSDASQATSDAAVQVQTAKMMAMTETAQTKAATAGLSMREKISLQAKVDAANAQVANAEEKKILLEAQAKKKVSATLLDGSKNFDAKIGSALSKATNDVVAAQASATAAAEAEAAPKTSAILNDYKKAMEEKTDSAKKVASIGPLVMTAKAEVEKVLNDGFSAITAKSAEISKFPPMVPPRISPVQPPEVKPILNEIDARMKDLGYRKPTPADAFETTPTFDPAKVFAGVTP